MENDLADQLIEANKKEEKVKIERDEYGIPLPQVKTAEAHCNYLVARAIYLNQHLHTRHNGKDLYNSHELVRSTVGEIARLAKWVRPMSRQEANYIYDKIKELMPALDESKIAITPNLLWDFEEQKLIETKEEINVISDW